MDSYQIHRDLMGFVVLKNEKIDWQGKFKLSWSGFGFSAEDCNGNQFKLISSGILFWRKLTLLKNDVEIDIIKINKSSRYAVTLKRGMDLYIDSKCTFSINNKREDSKHGQLLVSWESDVSQYNHIVYTLMLLSIQNRSGPAASAVP